MGEQLGHIVHRKGIIREHDHADRGPMGEASYRNLRFAITEHNIGGYLRLEVQLRPGGDIG